MEVIGRIKLINQTQTFGDKGFRKREMVVTTDEQYPQMIMIEFIQDKVDLLDNYKIGQDVKVSINLRGREWVNPEGITKYFNSVQGWRIENLTQSNEPISGQSFEAAPEFNKNEQDEEDVLPF